MRIKSGGNDLIEDKDFIVDYSNNIEPGTATVTTKGIGNYSGKVKKTFTIKKRIDINAATVDDIPDQTYSGEALWPNPVVKLDDKTLTKGTDYTLAYKNNTNAGKASIVLSGIGNYKGTKSVEFTIKPAAQTITANDKTVAMGKTVTIDAIASNGGALSYKSGNIGVVKIDTSGKIEPVRVGATTITITAAKTANYATKTITVTVTKGDNPIVVKSKTATVSATKVKKKTQTISAKKVFSISNAQSKVNDYCCSVC